MPGNGGQPRTSPDDDPSAAAADQTRRLRPAPQLPSPSESLTAHNRDNNATSRGTPGPKSGGGAAVGEGYGGGDTPVEVVDELQKQPETRPITQEQQIAEVEDIYSRLAQLESRCIEVVTAQASLHDNPNSPPPTDDQWQALVSLHVALLDEHHDFFYASQHPNAGPALRRLASKYAMPRRMWQHGIHSFLELLRHRLPGSSEYMLRFIYYAYSIMALLYETVPAFEDTWIECLGDLSRYRMAIEEDDIHDRNVWTVVSRSWYSKASDKTPTTGRFHHHLAILARPNIVAQLYSYLKSLTVAIPFESAKSSILTLFEPVISGNQGNLLPIDRAFIQVHSIFFRNENEEILDTAREEILDTAREEFLSNLDLAIARATRKWLEPGHQIAISNISATLGHGNIGNVLMKALEASRPKGAATDTTLEGAADDQIEWPQQVQKALKFTEDTDHIVMARLGDLNILSYLHIRLSFMYTMSGLGSAMSRFESTFHWHLLTLCLNSFIPDFEHPETYESPEWPKTPAKPLPEDWALRCLVWTENTFPANHFEIDKSEDDERMFESPSLGDYRRERVLWLACRLAEKNRWISYDKEARRFSPLPKYEDANIDTRPAPAKVVLDDEEILPDADAMGTAASGDGDINVDNIRPTPAKAVLDYGDILPDADTMGVAGGTSKDEQNEFPSLDNLQSDETLPDANVTGVDSVSRIGNDISLQPNNSTQDIPDKGSFYEQHKDHEQYGEDREEALTTTSCRKLPAEEDSTYGNASAGGNE